jgi:hypothetical protein
MNYFSFTAARRRIPIKREGLALGGLGCDRTGMIGCKKYGERSDVLGLHEALERQVASASLVCVVTISNSLATRVLQ